MSIPEWYRPIKGADPKEFSKTINRQLDLAQRDYDPKGVFAQRCELSWLISLSHDTRGIMALPAIYQSSQTKVLLEAVENDGRIEVSISVTTSDAERGHIYRSTNEEDLPIIVALLSAIGNIELAELETRPRKVLQSLATSPGSSIGFERTITQKTLEVPKAPGGGINLQYFKLSEYCVEARFARQVVFPEGTFVYQNNIIRDHRTPKVLYHHPRAFQLFENLTMGREYGGAQFETVKSELLDRPRRGELGMGEFEARLQQAGNLFIVPDPPAIRRLVSEPLSEHYLLRPV